MLITFIGLGNMGLPMAKNLILVGFQHHVYNRSLEKTKATESGAKIFIDPTKAVAGADIVIMLSDDKAVKEVSEKILPHMKKGSTHFR